MARKLTFSEHTNKTMEEVFEAFVFSQTAQGLQMNSDQQQPHTDDSFSVIHSSSSGFFESAFSISIAQKKC